MSRIVVAAALLFPAVCVYPQDDVLIPPPERTQTTVRDSAYCYFEYQVITVPKKTVAEAAAAKGLPAETEPNDALLPAIYAAGGYRVLSCAAGYSSDGIPAEFRLMRSEFFPAFYLMPNPKPQEKNTAAKTNSTAQTPRTQSVDAAQQPAKSDAGDEDQDDDASGESETDAAASKQEQFAAFYNNLAGVFPFFGDPTPIGNSFVMIMNTNHSGRIDSTLRKLTGFTNSSYGIWGSAQMPVFDDNSFASTLAATRGAPMIVAKSSNGNVWLLHVFYTKELPFPEKNIAAAGSKDKLVRLDFKIVRAKWNDICTAFASNGAPSLPPDDVWAKLSSQNQLRDVFSPSFRLPPSAEPVELTLNAKTQSLPLQWLPAQDPAVPAVPFSHQGVWTGTAVSAAPRILNDGKTIRVDLQFEKTSQIGWRNYSYSFYGLDVLPSAPAQNQTAGWNQSPPRSGQTSFAQRQTPQPEVLSGSLRLPTLDLTGFRQILYLDTGKTVLAARISNPAYQPDMLTLFFVTASIEDAPPAE